MFLLEKEIVIYYVFCVECLCLFSGMLDIIG